MSNEKINSFPKGMLAVIVIVSTLSGFLGGSLYASLTQESYGAQTEITPQTTKKTVVVEDSGIIDTVKKVSPAVVSIVISKNLPQFRNGGFDFNDFFNNSPFDNGNQFFSFPMMPQQQQDSGDDSKTTPTKVGGGSGFIVTADGLVVTNKHVVDDEQADYTIVTNDGKEYKAEVVSRDPINDIAFVRMKNDDGKKVSDLPFVTIGNSSDLQVGQRVVAIGNALAEYNNTVTSGVISAKGRSITAGSSGGAESLINLLQTDAAINPGNSGGPLVDINGNVIGINTAIASGAQGIGFAIPIDDVKPVIDSIEKNGKIIRPYLGVRYILLDKAKADELKIDVEGGALLTGDEAKGEFAVIPGSPADKAGLQMKDVIEEVGGKKVSTDTPLTNLIAGYKPGDEVSLKVWRSGKEITVKVTLAEAK